MEQIYREFLATRETKSRGFDLVEERGDVSRELRGKALQVLSRFPYDTYEKTGIFLFYDENLRSFAVARASEGKQVDNRVNMEILLRIPRDDSGDGFWICLDCCREWMGTGIRENRKPVGEYGISDSWQGIFIREWLRSVCALQAETIQVPDKVLSEEKKRNFALDLAVLAYDITPKSRLSKFSFVWNVPPEKCGGFRLWVGENPGEGFILDPGQKLTFSQKKPDSFMAERIRKEYLVGDERVREFVNALDWYVIKASDYHTMTWNFYYYLLDQKEPLPCNCESFFSLKKDLERQVSKGISKAKELYAVLLFSVLKTPLTKQEMQLLLNDCLDFFQKCREYVPEQLEAFLVLLEQYSGGGSQEQTREILCSHMEEIHKVSEGLYYALIAFDLYREGKYFAGLLGISGLSGRKELQEWIDFPGNRKLIGIPYVKDRIFEKLQQLFEKDSSVEEIKELIRTGIKVDEKRCCQLARDYLKRGTMPYIETADPKGWAEYLIPRRSIWRMAAPILAFLTEQYLCMAENMKMPCTPGQAEAMMTMGAYFARAEYHKRKQAANRRTTPYYAQNDKVQRIMILRLCDGAVLEKKTGSERETIWVLEILADWETGIRPEDPVLVKAKAILGQSYGREAVKSIRSSTLEELLNTPISQNAERRDELYRQWFERVSKSGQLYGFTIRVLEELQRRWKPISDFCDAQKIDELLQKLMDFAAENHRIREMEEVLKTGNLYKTKINGTKLLEKFWSCVSFPDFFEIRKWEEKLGMETDSLLRIDTVLEQGVFYRLYLDFCEGRSMEKLRHEINYRKKNPEETEEFLRVLAVDWFHEYQTKIAFSRLLDLLMAYWETEEEFFDAVESFSLMEHEKEALEKLAEREFASVNRKRNKTDMPYDLLKGGCIGAVLGLISCLWSLLPNMNGGVAFYALIFLMLIVGVVGLDIYLCSIQKPSTITMISLAAGMALWFLQLLLLKALNESIWFHAVFAVLILGVSVLGIRILKGRKRRESCRT